MTRKRFLNWIGKTFLADGKLNLSSIVPLFYLNLTSSSPLFTSFKLLPSRQSRTTVLKPQFTDLDSWWTFRIFYNIFSISLRRGRGVCFDLNIEGGGGVLWEVAGEGGGTQAGRCLPERGGGKLFIRGQNSRCESRSSKAKGPRVDEVRRLHMAPYRSLPALQAQRRQRYHTLCPRECLRKVECLSNLASQRRCNFENADALRIRFCTSIPENRCDFSAMFSDDVLRFLQQNLQDCTLRF